ncbi:MAG: nucleotidyltransferase [Clostridiales bacterium]|nr:nucleotidyltransferase [Clostridiales bacterium]
MKVVGLVTEYNPFHNGHLHHLIESKNKTDATHSIAVMSGHFLQRGEPALINKWSRAKAAVESGVDLVLEIPTLFSCSSAEYFSYGSIALLNALNIVDTVCFGSEEGTLNQMQLIANLLSSKDASVESDMSYYLKQGLSYPKARELSLNKAIGDDFTFKPNNILGIEYLKALNVLNSTMVPNTIQRKQADYMSLELKGHIASATGIRKQLQTDSNLESIRPFVPQSTFEMITREQDKLIYKEELIDLLLYKIRTSTPEEIRAIHDVSEGLENKIIKTAETATTYEELLNGIVSKRYTNTRVQRILVKILLNIKKETIGQCGTIDPLYGRILAFNSKGQELIRKIKKASDFPLVTNINKISLDEEAKDMLEYDIRATNIYHLLYKNTPDKKGGQDYLRNPERI